MYFYNPRLIKVYQSGGSTQQEMGKLQQKIDTLNEAIARADPTEIAKYEGVNVYTCAGIGSPTGEVTRKNFLPYTHNDGGQGRMRQHQRIQQDKIDARDYFQNKLDNLKVKKIQSLYRGNKARLLSKAEGRITDKQKRKDWPKIRQSLLDEGLTDEEIQSFYDNHYMASQQMGGAGIQNDIQDLQQKIDTLNEAITRADPGEVVVYNNGFPTGELENELYPIVNVGQDELFDGIQQEKIDARDYFQNKLDKLQAFNRAPLVVDELSEDIVANIMRHSQRGGIRKARYATSAYDGVGDLFVEPKFKSCESFHKKSTCVPHSECRWVGKGKTAHCELASNTSTSTKGRGRRKVKAGKVSPKGRDSPGKRLVVSGKTSAKRCKNGTRRNKKTGKCEKKK